MCNEMQIFLENNLMLLNRKQSKTFKIIWCYMQMQIKLVGIRNADNTLQTTADMEPWRYDVFTNDLEYFQQFSLVLWTALYSPYW